MTEGQYQHLITVIVVYGTVMVFGFCFTVGLLMGCFSKLYDIKDKLYEGGGK